MPKYKDLTNQHFNKLTAIKLAYIKNGKTYWECKCECGNTAIVRSDSFQDGSIKSCGCAKHNAKTHGFCGTKIYKRWEDMKSRCLNPNNKRFKDYGGRGIKIHQEWLDDFMNFYNWAMANGYDDKLSIDRIDVNGNYEPSNCRWVTQKIQMRNTRVNHLISYKGQTHCVVEWMQILGLKSRSIANKLYAGYPIEKLIQKYC